MKKIQFAFLILLTESILACTIKPGDKFCLPDTTSDAYDCSLKNINIAGEENGYDGD